MGDKAIEFAGEWLEKAWHDQLAAEALASQTPPLTDTAAFHCQQAGEKALKAFLTYHAVVFEKTHDIGRLCGICAGLEPAFERIRDRAHRLSDYGVRFRYPGSGNPTLEEVQEALVVVREIWDLVLEQLPQQLRQTYRKT